MAEPGRSVVSFRLPDELLAEVDRRAKNLGLTRSQWYENMTRWVLVQTYTKGGKTVKR
jgi:metal-responsive CopG/Arc/MetJ family transcriptional regulator